LYGGQTEDPTTGSITSEERDKGAITAHLFYCPVCGSTTRIVQNLSVDEIVKTKEGHSEEAAICFSAMVKAVGADSRIVFPSTSSNVVCVENWSTGDEEYVHIDPFTAVHDNPLRYEADAVVIDWVVAVVSYEVADVTKETHARDTRLFALAHNWHPPSCSSRAWMRFQEGTGGCITSPGSR
jgi:hypothetical protein